MIISDHKTLREIKEEFHRYLPHLRIEFYAIPHDSGEGSYSKELLDPDLCIGEVRTLHQEGDLPVDVGMTVAEFEQAMRNKYGLFVQVFRKSGNLWMQTTATDHWTLGEQNRKGGASEEAWMEKTSKE